MSKTLWAVDFTSQNQSFGSGVVVLDENFVAGGDSSYYYYGKCAITGNSASASVQVKQHAPGISIFGPINSFTLTLTGGVNGDQISFSGYVEEYPQFKINATMRKLANLV